MRPCRPIAAIALAAPLACALSADLSRDRRVVSAFGLAEPPPRRRGDAAVQARLEALVPPGSEVARAIHVLDSLGFRRDDSDSLDRGWLWMSRYVPGDSSGRRAHYLNAFVVPKRRRGPGCEFRYAVAFHLTVASGADSLRASRVDSIRAATIGVCV